MITSGKRRDFFFRTPKRPLSCSPKGYPATIAEGSETLSQEKKVVVTRRLKLKPSGLHWLLLHSSRAAIIAPKTFFFQEQVYLYQSVEC